MGNNEPPPPPPPHGFEPPHPPVPPVPPQQPPVAPPTGQYPPLPQQYPPQQFAPVAPVPAGPKKNTGLIVGVGVVVVAAVIGGIVLLTGKDNKKTTIPTSTPVVATDNTSATSTSATDATLVITAPPSSADNSSTTVADSSASGLQTVTDDTKTFKVYIPAGLNVDSTSVTPKGSSITLAHVTASNDLQAYYGDDDTFGISILVAGPSVNATADQLLSFLEPSSTVCGPKVVDPPLSTNFGDATVWRYESCGAAKKSAKVILVVHDATTNSTIAVYSQGPAPSDGTLLTFAQTILMTVQLV